MEQSIVISIIIPIHNAENCLRECLNSAVDQTLRDIEIICVDDGSEDGSRAIIEQYASRDERIRPVYHEQCLSASQSRKDGVMLARGKYILFMDSDDVLELNACADLAAEMDARGVDMLQFGTFVEAEAHVNPDTAAFMTDFARPYREPLVGQDVFRAFFSTRVLHHNLWNKIFRAALCKKAFAEVEDGYFPKAQDLYAFFFLARYAESYCSIETKYYHYKFGRGICGGGRIIGIDEFRRHCSASLVMQKIREYLIKQNGWDEYRDAWEELNQWHVNDCVCVWFRQLSDADGGIGFDEMADMWGLPCVLRGLKSELRDQLRSVCVKASGSKAFLQSEYLAEAMEEIARLNEELDAIWSSASLRIGRAITWLPRKLRGGVRCFREHGAGYTFRRALYHMGLRKDEENC